MNDLIGLAYRWGCRPGDGTGCTDCFQLVCAVRRQLGLPDHAAQFEWVYREQTAETFGLLHLRPILWPRPCRATRSCWAALQRRWVWQWMAG
jgi:hypothetical protein